MTLNHREYTQWREGLTVKTVIEENHFTWPKLVVRQNGKVVWPEEYEQTTLQATDALEIIHLLGGG
ncbi:MAG: sulfur carrier protein ThiS [Ruminococcaceae bacterium]|jgi:thiamine biosynthesis protein ThiS|nr:sulfur carrier protein ThiS [Oscillospiraceae bacterium]